MTTVSWYGCLHNVFIHNVRMHVCIYLQLSPHLQCLRTTWTMSRDSRVGGLSRRPADRNAAPAVRLSCSPLSDKLPSSRRSRRGVGACFLQTGSNYPDNGSRCGRSRGGGRGAAGRLIVVRFSACWDVSVYEVVPPNRQTAGSTFAIQLISLTVDVLHRIRLWS